MACGDVLSLDDLQTAKKHQIFEAEVITGKAGGVAGGGPIDYATNQVTGQVQKTMPAILRDLGFVSAAFDFTSGGTLTTSDRNTAVLWPVSGGGDGDWYVWGGALPKVVPAGSTPSSTGGIAVGAWRNVGSVILRQELANAGGGNISGWYDAAADVRAFNKKTNLNTWPDAVSLSRAVAGQNKPVVIGANASGVETVAIQYALPSGVTGYHLSQGTTAAPSTDKRPLILLEKVCDSGITFGPHSMANFSMKYVGGTNGAIPLSTYVEATGSSAGGAIGIQTRARILSPTASGWGGWSYVDVAGNLPVRAIGHEINVRCNLPAPLKWSASSGVVDGLVIATVDNGSNNMANSAIKISRSSQGQGFLTGIRIGYKTILPSDTTDLSVLNGEAFLINGGSTTAEQYGGIRIGANDGAGFTRFHYGIRLNEAQFNNAVAIWLGDNQRIRWGSALNSGPYLTCTGSEHQAVGAPLNIANGAASALRTDGLKVVGARVTGFARMTGTPLKTSFNADTATLQQVAQRLKAIEDALHADSGHGLYGLT